MFVQGGYANQGGLHFVGHGGYYWSSVGYDSRNAYHLVFDLYGVLPSRNFYRYLGYSVRCVALGG